MTHGSIRIALLDDYQNVALSMAPWDTLPEGVSVEVFNEPLGGEDRVAETLAPFQVVMAMRERTPFPRSLLERLPGLRLLATSGMRNAAIDLDAATELGIPVCGTQGGGVSTVELTWGLILALVRHIPIEHERMRNGLWQSTVGMRLTGKTLGLIGLGNLGGQMAKVALAFGMEVLAWSQNLTAARAAECGATKVDLPELLDRAHIVSIHLKLGERSRGLLGAKELGRMRPGAVLINTSRGPIVNEDDLVTALENGTIAGAALDVYDVEPLPAKHPLRVMDNVVLSPHLGYVTDDVYTLYYGETRENIAAWLKGEPTRLLNPEVREKARPLP